MRASRLRADSPVNVALTSPVNVAVTVTSGPSSFLTSTLTT